MPDIGLPADTTPATTALTTMAGFFYQQNHNPSAEHWAALSDILSTMQAMADGTARPAIFLSAVDPGVGKSQSVVHFARALIADIAARVGMIICVGRIAEAVALATCLNAPRSSFAVLTSDHEANALGSDDPTTAQVLITTQQRLERACDERTFNGASGFYYQGLPRAVRVWDEAWLPGVTIALTADHIFALLVSTRRAAPDMAAAMQAFALDLQQRSDGEALDVPDFARGFSVPLFDVIEGAGFRDDNQQTATALRVISGRRARVKIDNATGATMLTYRDTLPDDLAPLLVLDASARVRHVYQFIENHRGGIVRLREAVKDYSPLTVKVWATSGSKSGFEANSDKLIAGIVATIQTKPDERWLIVAHKRGGRVPDIARRLHRALPPDVRDKVETITWGNHLATNEYADVPNVVLAGTLFMRPSFYLALTHMAQGQDVSLGFADDDDVTRTTAGEHANLVLQALCRGRVRKSDGDRCLPMTAYVIASKRSGIPNIVQGVFPGCSVQPWTPLQRTLKGRALAALTVIEGALNSGVPWISYREVAATMPMTWANFRQQVCQGEAWTDHLAARGLVETIGLRKARGVRAMGDQIITPTYGKVIPPGETVRG